MENPTKPNETKPTDNKEPEKKAENNPSIVDLEAKLKQMEAENEKLRKANTAASADASQWKKKFQETLSEENRKKQEQEEAAATLQKELETLRAERNVANFKSQLTAPDIGFDSALAQETAEAMNGGDIAKVFDGLRRFIVAHDKALNEQALKNNPTLPGGGSTKTVTQEEFHKMGYADRLKIFNEQPELYKELMSKE